ncbi:MAG: DUF6806 family protein [Burkholderiales bacterium]|jgi:hypothetical protein
MRIEVHVHGDLVICKGVTRAQIETAIQPWLEYVDVDTLDEAKSSLPEEPGINFDPANRTLEICWTGHIGRSFQHRLEQALHALGPLTEQAAEVDVNLYHESGEEENQIIFVGPTPETIHEAQRQRMLDDVSHLLSRQFGQEAVEEVLSVVNGLFAREWQRKLNSDGELDLAYLQNSTGPGRRHLH